MTYKLTNTSQPADPYYGAVSLLLHGDGADGSTQIIDSSVNPKTVTAVGNAQISTAQSKFGGSSIYFAGNGDGLTCAASSSFSFETGDFTVEFWMYQTAQGIYDTIIDNNYATSPNFSIQSSGSNNARFILYLDGVNTTIIESSDHSINVWIHYAFVRNGSTVTIYRDGVSVGSGTYSGQVGNGSVTYRIAETSAGAGSDFQGYIDDFRITKGVARYTSNFTPPTQPFQSLSVRDPQFNAVSLLLKGDGVDGSTTIVDSSPTPKTVTAVGDAQISTAESKFSTSSLYFDGSGDYLSTGPDFNLALGSGDFTVEAFIYVTSLSSTSVIASSRVLSFAGILYWIFSVSSTGQLIFQSRTSAGTQYYAQSTTSAITTNTWYHVAGVRQSNVLTVYVNGVAGPTTANDGGNDLSESYVGVSIFNFPGFVSYGSGYIADLRITKGIARYTSNFTPPGPLPTF